MSKRAKGDRLLQPTAHERREEGRSVIMVRSGSAVRIDVIGKGRRAYLWVGGRESFSATPDAVRVLYASGEATLRKLRDALTRALGEADHGE